MDRDDISTNLRETKINHFKENMNKNNNITTTRTVTASTHNLPCSAGVVLFVVSVDVYVLLSVVVCEVSSFEEKNKIE